MKKAMIFVSLFLLTGCDAVGLFFPPIKPWIANYEGEAELAKATQNRKIKVQEAEAAFESSKLLAQAEIERAKGVAKANEIIGNSLRDNEAYLRYLWIHNLQEGNNEVIYVPTEANLPILEAQRLGNRSK